MPERVVVFIDGQNMYQGARRAFFTKDAPHVDGQFDPYAFGIKASIWGNPFRLPRKTNPYDDAQARIKCIEAYEDWLLHSESSSNPFWSIRALKGKDLVCWCSPLPCHGDVLIKLANK